jgi:hypothetical protein
MIDHTGSGQDRSCFGFHRIWGFGYGYLTPAVAARWAWIVDPHASVAQGTERKNGADRSAPLSARK